MSDIKIGDIVVGLKGSKKVTGTVMNIKEGHVHIKAPIAGVYAPVVDKVPLHKVTILNEGAMKRKAEDEDDAGMSDYMHHAQTNDAPFDDAKPSKPHKDEYGNPIKPKNVARRLAKMQMKKKAQLPEEVEQIEELSRGLLNRYRKAAEKQVDDAKTKHNMNTTGNRQGIVYGSGTHYDAQSGMHVQNAYFNPYPKHIYDLQDKRDSGRYVAAQKLSRVSKQVKIKADNAPTLSAKKQSSFSFDEPKPAKKTINVDYERELAALKKKHGVNEEVEQIDEISSGLARRYGGKAIRAHLTAKAKGDTATADKRAKGINLASAKAFPGQYKNSPDKAKVPATNEEVEQIDEIGDTPSGLARLKNVQARADHTMNTWSKNPKSGYSSTPPEVKKATKTSVRASNRINRDPTTGKPFAYASLKKEEVEQIDEITITNVTPPRGLPGKSSAEMGKKYREAAKKWDAENPPGKFDPKEHMKKVLANLQKEEVEQIDEMIPYALSAANANAEHERARKAKEEENRKAREQLDRDSTDNRNPFANFPKQVSEKAPPGFEGTVKAMKKNPKIDNPFALAWYMKNKGYKSHIKEGDHSGLSAEQIAKRKAMDAEDFRKRREEMNKKRQAGTAPLRTTFREELKAKYMNKMKKEEK